MFAIHTYSLENGTFHGDAKTYMEKLLASREGVEWCPRCEDVHDTLDWKLITNPLLSGPEGAIKSCIIGFAMCPLTDEPIVVEAWEMPDDNDNDNDTVSEDASA